SNEDAFAIGRNRHLRGFGGKLQVAAIEVERADALEVAFEFLARIFVGAGVPGHQTRSRQLQLVFQTAGREILVSNKVDSADSGDVSLENIEADTHPVTRQGRDDGIDLDPVLAFGQILLLQLKHRLLEQGAIKDSSRAKAYAA